MSPLVATCRRALVARAFHSSHTQNASRRATVTKKPFSELPKKPAVQADPCSEPAPTTPHDHSSATQSMTASDTLTTDTPPVRKRRQTTASESASPVVQDPAPRRRGRKPKAEEPALGTLPVTNDSPRRPRNSLATEILTNLSRFPHCILLTRVGQFYESYFDQASEVARLLGIKLTSRVWDKQDVAMCGFPIAHLDKYLKIMVQQHKRFVAMCEEFPRYTPGQKPEFDRRVVRVITPGTLIDEPFLNHFENNYLLAVSAGFRTGESSVQEAGLAWIDVSTGEFFTKTIAPEGLKDELAHISPREVVLAEKLKEQPLDPIRLLLEDEGNFLSYIKPSVTHEPLVPSDVTLNESVYTPQESTAINILTTYMRVNLMEHMPQLSSPNREGTEERMQIDSHTIKALEIRESTREGGSTGSLFSVIKRTVTSSGTRSLARRLCSPSTSIREIEARQSLVAFFYDRPNLRDDLLRLLRDSEDACRILQRFLSGKGEPKDLLAINQTIQLWDTIQNQIKLEKEMETMERGRISDEEWSSIDALLSTMTRLDNLSARITLALQDVEVQNSPPFEFAEGQVLVDDQSQRATSTTAYGAYKCTIRPEFSEKLTTLHSTLQDLLVRRKNMERLLQIQCSAPSLTLRTSPSQGMHAHIGRAKRDQAVIKIDSSFINISETGSTSSYFYQPWSHLGNQIIETTLTISNAEKEIFNTLRDEVKAFSGQLRHNSRIMDELDITLGFANLADELRFVRPVIKDDAIYEVINGRHPTVELGLLSSGRPFTPNSVALKPDSRLHIITGPNMAGKSTFLRQVALISILAQSGSFVPAEHAVVGIVDKLFSRVGAKDDLFRDRSTFMVEMLETAEILHRATPRSLVIMDEVGRGTTVKDGLAIAFATVHHLVLRVRCRTLFATHFHELADLLAHNEDNHHGSGVFRPVGFFCTDVHETEDNFFVYSHLLRPGVNRDSHGLKVAQLAGIPDSVVQLAKSVLSELRGQQSMDSKELSSIGRELTTS